MSLFHCEQLVPHLMGRLEKLLKKGSGYLVLLEYPGLQQVRPGQGKQRCEKRAVVGTDNEAEGMELAWGEGWEGSEGVRSCQDVLLRAVGAAACSQESRR